MNTWFKFFAMAGVLSLGACNAGDEGGTIAGGMTDLTTGVSFFAVHNHDDNIAKNIVNSIWPSALAINKNFNVGQSTVMTAAELQVELQICISSFRIVYENGTHFDVKHDKFEARPVLLVPDHSSNKNVMNDRVVPLGKVDHILARAHGNCQNHGMGDEAVRASSTEGETESKRVVDVRFRTTDENEITADTTELDFVFNSQITEQLAEEILDKEGLEESDLVGFLNGGGGHLVVFK